MKTKTLKSEQILPKSLHIAKQKPVTKTGKKRKVKKVMDEWKQGKLKTNAGKVVKTQKQAIAIALSESGQSYQDKNSKGDR
jgi:hypothetical protein